MKNCSYVAPYLDKFVYFYQKLNSSWCFECNKNVNNETWARLFMIKILKIVFKDQAKSIPFYLDHSHCFNESTSLIILTCPVQSEPETIYLHIHFLTKWINILKWQHHKNHNTTNIKSNFTKQTTNDPVYSPSS